MYLKEIFTIKVRYAKISISRARDGAHIWLFQAQRLQSGVENDSQLVLNMCWCIVGITRYFDRIPAWVNDPIGVQEQ
jgi:hypothetical protein